MNETLSKFRQHKYWRRIQKLLLISLPVLFALFLIGYIGLWFYTASLVQKQIDDFYARADENNIQISMPLPKVKGFPGIPEIETGGQVRYMGVTFDIPRLLIRSRFIPMSPFELSAPKGIRIVEPQSNASELWSINALELNLIIPHPFPNDFTQEGLREWHDKQGHIVIDRFLIQKSTLRLDGFGRFGLDQNLQPSGMLSTKLSGHNAFLGTLQRYNIINTKQAILATAVLNALSKTDEFTGEPYITAKILLENRTLFLDALRLTQLPKIIWPWRSLQHAAPHR